MRVDVDEPGRDHAAPGVDHPLGWPASPGPIAAMRSPSTATSAARAGAPLPSTTVPFRIRSDQAHDRYWGTSVIFTVFILSPTLILSTISMPEVTWPKTVYWPSRMGGGEHDVELAARRVRSLGARHRQYAADVLLLVELGLDGVAGAAGAVALGIAALHHEVGTTRWKVSPS